MKLEIDIKELYEIKKLHGDVAVDGYFNSIKTHSLCLLSSYEKSIINSYKIHQAGGSEQDINWECK